MQAIVLPSNFYIFKIVAVRVFHLIFNCVFEKVCFIIMRNKKWRIFNNFLNQNEPFIISSNEMTDMRTRMQAVL